MTPRGAGTFAVPRLAYWVRGYHSPWRSDSTALGQGEQEKQASLSVTDAATWHLRKSQGLTVDTAVISMIIAFIEHFP